MPGEFEVIAVFPACGPSSREVDLAAQAEARTKLFGRLAGQATIAEDFDASLPEEVLRGFQGGDEP